jgi:Kazal-type serine protease inhibitor domain
MWRTKTWPTKEKLMNHLGSILVMTLAFGPSFSAPALSTHAASRSARIILIQNPSPEICTEVYQPVCGTDPNGMRKTYSNACFARIAKATEVTPGECPK